MKFFSVYCGSENFFKQSMCLNEFYTTGYNSLSLSFTDRMWAIPFGDGYFVYFQVLEPTIGIPFAAYWTPVLGLYMLGYLFKYYTEGRAKQIPQDVDSTSKVESLSEKMRSDSELNEDPKEEFPFWKMVLGWIFWAILLIVVYNKIFGE